MLIFRGFFNGSQKAGRKYFSRNVHCAVMIFSLNMLGGEGGTKTEHRNFVVSKMLLAKKTR